jgi:hypothetical protein
MNGKTIESKKNFLPFKGIILEDSNIQVKAIPLMLADEATQLSGVEKGVQSISKKVNWTNTSLRGMATHTFVTNDYDRKGNIRDLQVSTNIITQSVNQINDRVADIYDRVGKTQNIVIQKTEDSAKNHEELMEGLGESFSVIGKTLLEIKKKDTTPDKPIPQSFILPQSPISIISHVYKPEEKSSEKKFPIHFPKEEPNSSSSSTNPNLSMVSIQRPSYENIPHHMNRPLAPGLLGKGKMPESQSFAEYWFLN